MAGRFHTSRAHNFSGSYRSGNNYTGIKRERYRTDTWIGMCHGPNAGKRD